MNAIEEVYRRLNTAFDYYNQSLFESRLPKCIIILPRQRAKSSGHFAGDTWESKVGTKTDEISLNPFVLKFRSDEEVLSTLVHEMCHLEQFHFGKPGRNGYHNLEFKRLMLRVGLIPSVTGLPDGKMTGQSMSHYIQEKGRFDNVTQRLLARGFELEWFAIKAKGKNRSKIRYSCRICGVSAWGKPSIHLICGICLLPMSNG